MDPITSTVVVSVAGTLAASLITHLFGWLGSRSKDVHVQNMGTIIANGTVAGAQAAAQAAATGAKPADIGRAAAAAAVSAVAPVVLGPPSPAPADAIAQQTLAQIAQASQGVGK